MISKEEVQHIAKLARLGINQKEEEKFAGELSSILDYIEKLKEVSVKNVEATSYSNKIENITRKDIGGQKSEKTSKLLELFPDRKNRFLKTKQIL
jgi:aspartyl-tRNA(Asn)/glutamyl-tRNA(Gln) amidotransferase subunit C